MPQSLPIIPRRYRIRRSAAASPKTGPVAASRSMTLPYSGQTPHVPEGFTATAFAIGLEHPRRLLVLPNGDVLVAEQKVGYVSLLRDEDGDGGDGEAAAGEARQPPQLREARVYQRHL